MAFTRGKDPAIYAYIRFFYQFHNKAHPLYIEVDMVQARPTHHDTFLLTIYNSSGETLIGRIVLECYPTCGTHRDYAISYMEVYGKGNSIAFFFFLYHLTGELPCSIPWWYVGNKRRGLAYNRSYPYQIRRFNFESLTHSAYGYVNDYPPPDYAPDWAKVDYGSLFAKGEKAETELARFLASLDDDKPGRKGAGKSDLKKTIQELRGIVTGDTE